MTGPLALWLLLAAPASAGFTPDQIFYLTNDNERNGPLGAETRCQYFYHFFKRDRDPELTKIVPAWIDQSLDAMVRRPVWRDPEEGVLNEAQLWQAPASVLYEFFQHTRKTFPLEKKGSMTPPAILKKDYEDSRTRFQMALDRLYRARLGDSLGGRGRAILASFDLILKEMDVLLDALTSQDEQRYVDAVMAVGSLTKHAYRILERTPRGYAPPVKENKGAFLLATFIKIAGCLLMFVAFWSLGVINAEKIAEWIEQSSARSRAWAQEFNRQFVQVKIQYLVVIPAAGGLLLGILTFDPFGFILMTAAGAYMGYNAPRWVLNAIRIRRGKKVEEQLMDAMILMSNALKSGLDIVQGFELVSRDLAPPISEEFGLVIKNYQLGTPFEKALLGMEDRIASRLLSYVIKAITIQRSVGGNLTKIFDRIVDNIREEGKLEEKMQSLTAQQRIQSVVVGIMPWAMLVLMFVFQPETMSKYYFSLLGLLTVVFCVIWMTIGMGIVRKLADIQV